MNSFSREGYLAIRKEVVENVALTPNIFIPLMSEDISTEYQPSTATPIAADRTINQRAVPNMIPSPSGTLTVLAGPKTLGHFLNGVFGDNSQGVLVEVSALAGQLDVGETLTGGTSGETATVVKSSNENDYILVSGLSGNFTVGETLTGGTSGETATVLSSDVNRLGHEFTAPSDSLDTYTVEIGYKTKAKRYTGVTFNQIEFTQSDNIIQAAIGVLARSSFHNTVVEASLSSGAGTQTINVDQTTGLASGDSIKVMRDGVYLDFSSSSVKTHTIDSVVSETSITITNLETTLLPGDLIVLAPQVPTYSTDREFSWIGGSIVSVEDDIVTAVTAPCASIEDFTFSLVNTLEPLHAACNVNFINRFPSKHILAGLEGSGSLTRTHVDVEFIQKLRKNKDQSVYQKHIARNIPSTSLKYELRLYAPTVQFDAFDANLDTNALIKEEIGYNLYKSTAGYTAKALLVNDVATY